MSNNLLLLSTLNNLPMFTSSKFSSSYDIYKGKNKLTKEEIAEIWGNLPQTLNEEDDAIKFGMAIQEKLLEINK